MARQAGQVVGLIFPQPSPPQTITMPRQIVGDVDLVRFSAAFVKLNAGWALGIVYDFDASMPSETPQFTIYVAANGQQFPGGERVGVAVHPTTGVAYTVYRQELPL